MLPYMAVIALINLLIINKDIVWSDMQLKFYSKINQTFIKVIEYQVQISESYVIVP